MHIVVANVNMFNRNLIEMFINLQRSAKLKIFIYILKLHSRYCSAWLLLQSSFSYFTFSSHDNEKWNQIWQNQKGQVSVLYGGYYPDNVLYENRILYGFFVSYIIRTPFSTCRQYIPPRLQ